MLHTFAARRAAGFLVGVLSAVVVLSGCSSSTAGEPAPVPASPVATSSARPATTADGNALPTRVRTFDVAGLNPCTLVTTAQLAAIGVNQPPQGPDADTPEVGSTQCAFIVSDPITGCGVSANTARNAASIAASADRATVETVGGVGAVVVDGQGTGCTYVLDTSDTTTIEAGATSRRSTAAIDCPKARALADATAATLTALQPG